MAREECGFDCKASDDLKELSRFQGKVLACLESINASIREMKDNNRTDGVDVWNAINGLRSDIKEVDKRLASDIKAVNERLMSLYWRIGFIAGGSALVITLVTNLVASIVGGKVK